MDDTQALTTYQFTIDSAVAEWLAQKTTRTGSHKTRKAYEDTMRQFRATLARGGLDLLSNPIDIARVAALWANQRTATTRRAGQDVSPSTYNQRLAILSSWYTFVQHTYKLDIPNPIKDVKQRPVQAYAPAEPNAPETVERGLDAIDRKTDEGLRNYALLAVALATGRRASELAGLRGADVRITGGRKEPPIRLTFPSTDNKIMRDLLDAEASAVVLEYLHAQYGKNVTKLAPDAPVWVSYSRQNRGQAPSTKHRSTILVANLQTTTLHP